MLFTHILFLLLGAVATVTGSIVVTGWNALACGNEPQRGTELFTMGFEDAMDGCTNTGLGEKIFSITATSDTDMSEIWAYALPNCKGQRRLIEPETCLNPDINIKYFQSYKITFNFS
ncbi:hypothetical protein N7495_004042 [Penicillium taxi]|uniref:uncharacterized protein n=1 Tax=Penicillium taxi TaxID=168475 RepID=UPI00254557A5|nr:uncharacterized protein N7495_004042 [Penicillium taxi]KAJ5899298.1 hypothetical protein N7495_004042 [Penicillium taxi]